MNTPATVNNASARLTMESVNRLIEMEVNAATAKMRGENEKLRQSNMNMCEAMIAHNKISNSRMLRDGKMMVVIGIAYGIVGLIAGYLIAGVLMR